MRFLVDECLHESLVGVAQVVGFGAADVNHLGLRGKPDWELAARAAKDEFTLVTNNRADFLQLFKKSNCMPGLLSLSRMSCPQFSVLCSGPQLDTWQERN